MSGKRRGLTRSSESDGRSDVTDNLDCRDKFRVRYFFVTRW